MKLRKQVLIDKSFQLKKTFTVTGFVAALIAVIMTVTVVIIHSNNGEMEGNNQGLLANTSRIQEIMELQQNIYVDLSIGPKDLEKMVPHETANELIKSYKQSIDNLINTIESNENLVKSNRHIMIMNYRLLVVVIVVFAIGIAILYFLLIKQTHRISGPISIMTGYINEILEGKNPDMRSLREKDDLKEFYDLLKKLALEHLELKKHREKVGN